MNRSRSDDSLDNGDHDVICSSSNSSSPTDFTSDDETCTNLFLMSGQPLNSASRPYMASSSLQTANKTDKMSQLQQYGNNYALQSRHSLLHAPNRPMLTSGDITNQLSYIDASLDNNLRASTSCYDGSASRINRSVSRNADTQQDSSGIALNTSDRFITRRNDHIENINSNQSLLQHRRSHRDGLANDDYDSKWPNMSNYLTAVNEDLAMQLIDRAGSQVEAQVATLGNPSRNSGALAIRLCARLVECRNLLDAIDFVERNRDLIDNLTRIITVEAPAFRNYNFSNYQIDYSVKESFNPNFWLDREPIVTTADGNCQYHAVSISLTGSEAYTPEVRLATAVAVIDNREWFDSMLKLIDRGTVLDLVHTIARNYSWGDETTLKAIAVAINRRIFLYTCNVGKKDFEMVKSLSKEELLDAFEEKKYRGGTGIHAYADPLIHVPANDYIMLFHKSEHFIAVLPTDQQLTMFEPYNPIVPVFS